MADFNDFEVEIDGGLEGVTAWDGQQAPLVAVGTYRVLIANVEDKVGPKAPYAKLTMNVISAIDADGNEAETPEKDNRVWQNYSFSKDALGRVKSLMVACGAQLDKFRAGEIQGAEIIVDVVHNAGKPQIGEDGIPKEVKFFANVQNERPYQAKTAAKAATKAATPTPAAAKGNGTNTTTTAARRA